MGFSGLDCFTRSGRLTGGGGGCWAGASVAWKDGELLPGSREGSCCGVLPTGGTSDPPAQRHRTGGRGRRHRPQGGGPGEAVTGLQSATPTPAPGHPPQAPLPSTHSFHPPLQKSSHQHSGRAPHTLGWSQGGLKGRIPSVSALPTPPPQLPSYLGGGNGAGRQARDKNLRSGS